jgi:hypothetical protein
MNTLFILLNLGEKNKNSEGMSFPGNPKLSNKIYLCLREGR